MTSREVDKDIVSECYMAYASQLENWIDAWKDIRKRTVSDYPANSSHISYKEFVRDVSISSTIKELLQTEAYIKVYSVMRGPLAVDSRGDLVIQLRATVLGSGFYSLYEARTVLGCGVTNSILTPLGRCN